MEVQRPNGQEEKDMLRLNYVRDYAEIGYGKVYNFVVDENKSISIDTDKDNAIMSIWFHDIREDNSVVEWFTCTALVYIENIMSDTGMTIDMDKLALFDKCFKDEEVC